MYKSPFKWLDGAPTIRGVVLYALTLLGLGYVGIWASLPTLDAVLIGILVPTTLGTLVTALLIARHAGEASRRPIITAASAYVGIAGLLWLERRINDDWEWVIRLPFTLDYRYFGPLALALLLGIVALGGVIAGRSR